MQLEVLNNKIILVLKRFAEYVIGLEISEFPEDKPIIEQIIVGDKAWYIRGGFIGEVPENILTEVSQELAEIYFTHPAIPVLVSHLTQNFARGQWKPSEPALAEISLYIQTLKERGF